LKIIIVGGGAIGKHAADILSKKNNNITILEKDKKRANELANSLDSLVINDEGTDMISLKNAGIETTDAFIALTGDDKVNLMGCEIAKNIGVPHIITRINNPGNEELFVKLGINMLIPVTQDAVNLIDNHLSSPGTRVLAEIGDNKAQIIEIMIPESSKFVGHKGVKIDDGTISAIYRNGLIIMPEKNITINAGDVVIIVAKTEHISKITKQL